MKQLFIYSYFLCGAIYAQTVVTEFPAGASPISADGLKEAISGKVFNAAPSKGPAWKLQFKHDGNYDITAGSFSDSGKWTTKDSSLCTEPQKSKASCNEVRAAGADYFLKRDSGEVIKLTAQ